MVRKNITLIPFTEAHIEKTYTWITNADLQRLFLVRGQPTWEGHIAYFKQVLSDRSQCVFAIMYESEHCGNCGLKNIIFNQDAELWLYIGESHLRGNHIGKKVIEILTHEAFEVLNLNMVYVHFGDFNNVARHLYEYFGFKQVPLRESNNKQWQNRKCKIIRMELKRI